MKVVSGRKNREHRSFATCVSVVKQEHRGLSRATSGGALPLGQRVFIDVSVRVGGRTLGAFEFLVCSYDATAVGYS